MSTGLMGRTTLVTYRCPRCANELEAEVDPIPVWFRCPHCGRASQPPEPVIQRRRNSVNEVLVIGERGEVSTFEAPPAKPAASPTDPLNDFAGVLDARNPATPPRPIFRPAMPQPLPPPSTGTPTGRIVLGLLFFIATVLFVFSALAQDGLNAGVFGLGAVVLLMLLARPTRRRL